MKILEDLFVADTVRHPEEVVYALRRRKPLLRLYCVVYFADRTRFEILHSLMLFSVHNGARDGIICGVANGQRSAYELFGAIVEEMERDGKDITKAETWVQGAAVEEILDKAEGEETGDAEGEG